MSKEADDLAGSFSKSETEKQLILEIFKNRNFPEHLSLKEQIEECYLVANKKRIIGENEELKRALKSGELANGMSASSFHDSLPEAQPKLAPADAAELARIGFKWNTATKRYEKKLSNGKILARSSNGQTQLVG